MFESDLLASQVSIVGLGPWGLCALERIINASHQSTRPVVVHVIEPRQPGGGIFSEDQPDYLVLNTPCGQHSVYPSLEPDGPVRLGLGFYEWACQQGYKWQGWRCVRGEEGVPISPYDFLPRRLMGEYLSWAFEVLCAEAPDHVRVAHHRTTAIDIEPVAGGKEKVHLADGTQLVVDNVVLTTGHMPSTASHGVMGEMSTRPYPLESYLSSTGPGQNVAIEGMGLVALDVLTALTMGLGGSYSEEPGDKLRYHPSGREPSIYMFSRSGYPYCAKSFGASDPMGDYRPAICTIEAISALKQPGADGCPGQVDARRQLLPLVFAEMELRYYTAAAHVAGGPEAARGAHGRLAEAWASGHWEQGRAAAARLYGEFDAAAHFFVGQGRHYHDGEDYQAQVYAEIAEDARQALVPSGASPVKAALETLRALRDTLRFAVEFKGLNLGSHLDFVSNLQSRFARLVAGPPVMRSQQMLALMDAGVLHMSLGPSPEVLPQTDGRVRLRSKGLEAQHEVVVDRFVHAHLELPSLGRTSSPLLANLAQRGRLKPLDFDGTAVGSIDITTEFHPVNRAGQVEPRLWVFGVLSEGARYFTLYIPSPKSRVRAFVDAELCARAVTAMPTATTGEAQGPASELLVLPRGTRAGAGPRARAVARLRVALVNNMPDGAFEETEEQFSALLAGGVDAEAITFERYTLPGIERARNISALMDARYGRLSQLFDNPPDALVVTGAKPQKAELTEELFWPALDHLLNWAATSVPSALVSCLSAHGACWAFDQLPRRLLLAKCHGVFPQVLDGQHPLVDGVRDFAVPHSRFNEVPTADLVGAGYQVVSRSLEGAWTVAVGERAACQFTLLQGHPEYQRLTLLREYRRDVRAYLMGNQGSYPHLPLGYLGPEGAAELSRFEERAKGADRGPACMDDFPFEAVAADIDVDWDRPSRVLMGNWAAMARQRAGLYTYSGTGA